MESSEEAGCQAREGPKLCINNCGFFGSATTMNMCSKCHKDMVLKQQEANLAASSIEKIVNGSSNSHKKVPIITDATDVEAGYVELNAAHTQLSPDLGFGSGSDSNSETNTKDGPNRCTSCLKRLGLTGFKCKCGKLFCSSHRYSDKHDCSFDYRSAARDAIAKENPVVKAAKLDKI